LDGTSGNRHELAREAGDTLTTPLLPQFVLELDEIFAE